jgi:exo-beta-1,3-glucanase (GH17 family)
MFDLHVNIVYNAPTSYSSMAPSPSTTAPVYVPTSSGPPTVPTPLATTCPTPGVYTIPAVTITVTEETTVCAETSTTLPASGTYTVGGVTTVVVEETTLVCPYATISTSGTVVTEIIETTTYVCPSAGTYTIAPLTTVCETETVWVYPTVASYPPGTYTQNEVITTITETDYVVFCPFTSGAPVATSVPAPPVSTTPASTPNTGSLGTSGNQWAITYSPYENNGACKDAGSVASDIAEIAAKGFTSVRIYSTDCSGLENVGSACANEGLKLILGIFITTTGCSGAQQQVTDIITWGQWDLVELIVIGNEAVFSEYASASELASFISSCKSAFSGAGYTGPCTTTEPLNIWQENIDIFCEVVDVVGCNIHPFFNSDVTADQAGDFVASQLAIVDSLCTGKYGVNLETGWPSAGTCNGVACPGPDNQATAVALISEAAGGKSVMFSFVNDYWKDPGAFGCEQSWGSIQFFGN